MEVVAISISSTSTKSQANFLHRNFTVNPMQLYHIKVCTTTNTYTIKKRYRQFYSLHIELSKVLPRDIQLPEFPGKSLLSMSHRVVSFRKLAIEKWLMALVNSGFEKNLVFKFLKANKYMVTKNLTADDLLVLSFVERILKESNKKIAFLVAFEKEFFMRRRLITPEVTDKLLRALIPLCADENCINKPIGILSKLMNRDFYKYFENIQRQFLTLPIEILRDMNLKDYLKKKIHPDYQAKAYEILKLFGNGEVETRKIHSIVRHNQLEFDQDAFSIFSNWGVYEPKTPQVSANSQVNQLINTRELKLSYCIIAKSLLISGSFEVNSKIKRIKKLILSCEKRKDWDLRLESLSESDSGFLMSYKAEKSVYQFSCSSQVIESSCSVTIEMKSNLVSCPSSEFTQFFSIERIQSNDSINFADISKIRCTWSFELKGKASKIFTYDILGEDNLLQNSFLLLSDLARSKTISICARPKNNSIYEAINRKNKNYK